MEKKLIIPFGEYKIVAEINDSGPDFPNELCVYIRDNKGVILQDICLVRPHYEIDHQSMQVKRDEDLVDCLVWGESDCEDYTDKYIIDVYEEEE